MKDNIPKMKVKFFAGMREASQEKEREIELRSVSNIRDLLDLLCNTYERRQRVFNQTDQLRSDLVILKNGRNIDFLGGIETELKDGDTVAILPPLYGG
jgi:molybdopterin synthase sulfur carrier subunit